MLYKLNIISEEHSCTIYKTEEVYVNPQNVLYVAPLDKYYVESLSDNINISGTKDDMGLNLIFSGGVSLRTTLGGYKEMLNEMSWNIRLGDLK